MCSTDYKKSCGIVTAAVDGGIVEDPLLFSASLNSQYTIQLSDFFPARKKNQAKCGSACLLSSKILTLRLFFELPSMQSGLTYFYKLIKASPIICRKMPQIKFALKIDLRPNAYSIILIGSNLQQTIRQQCNPHRKTRDAYY